MAETASASRSSSGTVGWAIGLMLLANLLFAFVDTSTKWLLASGFVALQLAFMRYLVHFAITLVDVRRRANRNATLSWKTRGLVFVRAFCLISSTVANFIALRHLPLAVSSAILFVAPVIVCLLSALVLRERVKLGHWLAIVCGFSGVIVMIRPFDGTINLYAVLMLYPATGMAIYALLTRKLAHSVRPSTMQFYTGALGSAVLLPFAILNWQWPTDPLNWVLFIMIGAFAWAGHEAMTRAHSYTTANVLMPFGYSFVIYLSFASWLVFDEAPDLTTILGSSMIVASGFAIWHLNR